MESIENVLKGEFKYHAKAHIVGMEKGVQGGDLELHCLYERKKRGRGQGQ